MEPLLERARALGPPSTQVPVHGDLHLRHVLVGPTGRAAGIIDWGDCCVGDPSIDLSFGFAAFEGDSLDAFVAAYGGVSADEELRARALAFGLCTMLAVYSHQQGREGLLTESLAAMTRASAVDRLSL